MCDGFIVLPVDLYKKIKAMDSNLTENNRRAVELFPPIVVEKKVNPLIKQQETK